MTAKVHCSPARPPPKICPATAPNSSGASAWAKDRSRVRIDSARPRSRVGRQAAGGPDQVGQCGDQVAGEDGGEEQQDGAGGGDSKP